MTLREDLLQLKVDTLMKREKDYEFPTFMRLLRKSMGFSRKAVAQMLGVSESKMYYLEEGRFIRGPDPEFITTLAHFYGLSGSFALRKFSEYTTERLKIYESQNVIKSPKLVDKMPSRTICAQCGSDHTAYHQSSVEIKCHSCGYLWIQGWTKI